MADRHVRFCSACGTALAAVPPVTCASCGVSHWANPKPCANAVVVHDRHVLLSRRAADPWRGRWGSPGGFTEPGEHPITTAEREVLEETGLRVRVTGYLGVWVDEYTDDPAAGGEIINVAYYLAEPDGPIQPAIDPAEVSELGWFDWDRLPPDQELAPPTTLAAVLAVARNNTGVPVVDRPQ